MDVDLPHLDLGNNRIAPTAGDAPTGGGEVVVVKRLGGLLHSYRHSA